jgi:pimeloyl-ACP methyl ester carboxylesterase
MRALIVEMPVLDNALLACALIFTPLTVALTFGEPLMRAVKFAANAVPREKVPFWPDVALDWIRQDPGPSAAVLQGLFYDRVAPPREVRRELDMPALVIGHTRDPLHPFDDAGALAEELPRGRLLVASSFFEMRFMPRRLTEEIAEFLDECWRPRRARRAPAQKAS